MNRRHFVSRLLACPVCVATCIGQEWNYGDAGPEKWGGIDRSFSACAAGDQQSPVDLRDGIHADLPRLQIRLPKDNLTVSNNGHTIQVSAPGGSSIEVGASNYSISQFHFHTPSEHAIAGKDEAMEVHFVCTHSDGKLTVLAALLAPGGRNAALSAIMEIAPGRPDGKAMTASPIEAGELLPSDLRSTWRYAGSLTTPPCSQTVDWIVFDRVVSVADRDIARFRQIFPMNARPRQPLNRRYLLRS